MVPARTEKERSRIACTNPPFGNSLGRTHPAACRGRRVDAGPRSDGTRDIAAPGSRRSRDSSFPPWPSSTPQPRLGALAVSVLLLTLVAAGSGVWLAVSHLRRTVG